MKFPQRRRVTRCRPSFASPRRQLKISIAATTSRRHHDIKCNGQTWCIPAAALTRATSFPRVFRPHRHYSEDGNVSQRRRLYPQVNGTQAPAADEFSAGLRDAWHRVHSQRQVFSRQIPAASSSARSLTRHWLPVAQSLKRLKIKRSTPEEYYLERAQRLIPLCASCR